MAGKFNAKFFNGEVFQKYIDRIPNPRKTELLKSRAIRGRPELASSMRDEVGGNYISTPLKGLISGSVPMNYDGNTDITPSSTETFMQSRVVVGRANAWAELDFSYDITGGEDFMENVAEQVNDYWNEIDQDTLIAILKGVFSMTDTQDRPAERGRQDRHHGCYDHEHRHPAGLRRPEGQVYAGADAQRRGYQSGEPETADLPQVQRCGRYAARHRACDAERSSGAGG